MKKAFTIILLVLSVGMIFAETFDVSKIDAELANYINELNQERRETVSKSDLSSEFKSAVKQQEKRNKESVSLLSQKDIDALFTKKDPSLTIKKDDALSDVDLLFRLLKYKYGNYYIYGGDSVFNSIKKNIENEIKNKKTLSKSELEKILATNLATVIKESHFRINDRTLEDYIPELKTTRNYKYFYSVELFDEDDNGYYQMENNVKYYYKDCDNKNAFITKSLTDKGELVNRLICFCPEAEIAATSTVTLTSSKNTTKKTVEWEAAAEMSENHSTVEFLQTDNIAYIKCAVFEEMNLRMEMWDFVETARVAKESKVVILDMRSNGGGDDSGRKWLNSFVGEEVDASFYEIGVCDVTNSYNNAKTTASTRFGKGRVYESEPLFIILTDDIAGSAGDDLPFRTKFVENSIIIGTNTKGIVTGGASSYGRDCRRLNLPKTGFYFWVGSDGILVSAYGDERLLDNIGCTPNIWCEPKNLLQNVVNMLKNYNVISETEANDFIGKYNNRKSENMAGKIEDYPTELKFKKVESEYGTYYELRTSLTQKHPYVSAKLEYNGNRVQLFRTELTAFCNWDIQPYVQASWYSDNSYYCSTNGTYTNELICSDAYWLSEETNFVISATNIYQRDEVVLRVFPTNASCWINIGQMPYNETRPALEILDLNPEIFENNMMYYNGEFIQFKDWKDNYLKKDLASIRKSI